MPSVTMYPGTASETDLSSVAWTNLTNVEAHDGALATCSLTSSSFLSRTIVCTNFNFASVIGSGYTINGIQADIFKDATASGSRACAITDSLVNLILSGSGVGSNKADTVTLWPGTVTDVAYGGASDMWGATLTASNIRDTTFGIWVKAQSDITAGDGVAGIDAISLTINYTAGTRSNPPILSGGQMSRYGIRTGGRLYRHPTYSFPARIPGRVFSKG